MAGIYIHIPYCSQACHYCDFHFSTNQGSKSKMIQAICKELHTRKSYLENETVETIYLGGGTPSLLNEQELGAIIQTIYSSFVVDNAAEVTVEANPEDISSGSLKVYHELGVNRLSLGVQSFNDSYLKFLNRNHTSSTATRAIELIQNSEIKNFSIDLIFGIKPKDTKVWKRDISQAIALSPPHLSVYNLTIEEKTVFGNWARKGQLDLVEDDQSANQYKLAHELLEKKGYSHYEISNYCQEGYISRHNSSYWLNKKYLGVGPGAHSYDIGSRQHNIANNALYIKGMDHNKLSFTKEVLSTEDRINERILTGLRTKWGCDAEYLISHFGYDIWQEKSQEITSYQNAGLMFTDDQVIKLTLEGQLLADPISQELMI